MRPVRSLRPLMRKRMIKTLIHKRTIRPSSLIFYIVIVALFFTLNHLSSEVYSQDYITPENAGEHIGETQTVCGTVASTNYAIGSKGQPTFLNLDKPYPNHIFTVVIWVEYRARFKNPPETFYKGKGTVFRGFLPSIEESPRLKSRNHLG